MFCRLNKLDKTYDSVSDNESSDDEELDKLENKPRKNSNSKTRDKSSDLETLVLGGDNDVLKSLEASEQHTEHGVTKAKKLRVDIDNRRRPVWHDPDDHDDRAEATQKSVKTKKSKQNLKTERYSHKLKSKFENVTGTPNWASKRVDDVVQSDSDSDAEELRKSTGDSLVKSRTLPKGTIEIKRCTDANHDSPHGAKLKCIEFHPSAQVMLSAGLDYRLSLFQVDGKNNPLIQSTYFTRYPIYTAHFSADGNEVIVGSIHANFYYYDMIAGKIVNVPRIKAISEASMRHFEMSPDGKFIAFRGNYGFIHLISAKSKEWITSLKMNGNVTSIAFSHDGSTLYSHGEDSEVYVWDMRTRDCVHRFYDDGCIHGTCVTVSKCSRFLATGSDTGVVNIYDTSKCLQTNAPRPLKAVMNLTTKCTSLRFNSTSELLAMSSAETERGVKLLHMPSLSVFSNFPDRFTDRDMRLPLDMDISLNSGFLSIASHTGHALLYRSDGTFIISGLSHGSYIVEVVNPSFVFETARVDVTTKGKIRARRVDNIQPQSVKLMTYPLEFRERGKANYFIARETFKMRDILFSPMMLMMVLPLLLIMVMPKLINSSDPETRKEMDKQFASLTGNGGNTPDLSEMLTRSLVQKTPSKNKAVKPKAR